VRRAPLADGPGRALVLPAALVAATLLLPAGPALPAGLLAQEPRIVTSLDTTTITVGDRLTLDAIVEHAPDAAILWPDSLDLAPFEVIAVDTLPEGRGGGRARSGFRIFVTAFELGALEIPPLTARVVSAEGDTTSVSSDRWRVEVVSVGLDEEGGIREIRGPRSIPIGVWGLFPWLAGVLLVALLTWWWLRRRGGPSEAPTVAATPARPAHDVALEALATLEAADLPGRGEIKRFHVEVSEIVRIYLERRYGVPALETTTRELMTALQTPHATGEVPSDVRHDLRRLLERCDLVKFAKYEPPPEASRELVPLARAIVERTRPAPPEPDARAGGVPGGDEAPEADTPEGRAPEAGEDPDADRDPDAARAGASGGGSPGVDATGGGGS